MNLFCTQCGAQNPEDAQHCSSCGAAIVNPAAPQQAEPVQAPPVQQYTVQPVSAQQYPPQQYGAETVGTPPANTQQSVSFADAFKKFTSSKLFIPCVAGVAGFFMIVLIIVLIAVFSGNNLNRPVDKYLDAIVSANAEDYLAVYPEAFHEYLDDMDFDIDDLQDALDEYVEEREDDIGNKIKVRFEITDENQLSDSKLSDLKDSLNRRYDMPRRDLTEAWEVDVDVILSGSRDDTDFSITVLVIRYDGKWYICPEHFSSFIYYY